MLHTAFGFSAVTSARYEAIDARRVRVTGSRWVAGRYTVKLEGATLAGYQTSILAVLRDPHYVTRAQKWAHELHAYLTIQIAHRIGLNADAYSLEFRLIGMNSALGSMDGGAPPSAMPVRQ